MQFEDLIKENGKVDDPYVYCKNTGVIKTMMAVNSEQAIAITNYWHEFFLWETAAIKRELPSSSVLAPYKAYAWSGVSDPFILSHTPGALALDPSFYDDDCIHVAILYRRNISSPLLDEMAELQTEFEDAVLKHHSKVLEQRSSAEALARRICLRRIEHERRLNAAIEESAALETRIQEILDRANTLRMQILA